MKKIIAVVAVILMTGCSAFGSKHTAAHNTDVNFDQPEGNLVLTVDSDGEMVKVVSTGIAEVRNDDASGRAAAMTTAELRSKAIISEFITNSIKSNKSVSTISKATQETNEHVQSTVENISSRSAQLLKGVMVSKKTMSDGFARVEVTISRQSIRGAASLKDQMAGAIVK